MCKARCGCQLVIVQTIYMATNIPTAPSSGRDPGVAAVSA